MKKIAITIAALSLSSGAAFAQITGNADQGAAYWTSNLHQCKNCHGGTAEGAFGPDLAGRGLSAAQVYRAAHQPWGIMPAFVDTQLNQQQAADLAAFFASRPKPAEPGKWRFEATPDMPAGQAMLINMGCGQCHSPNFQGPSRRRQRRFRLLRQPGLQPYDFHTPASRRAGRGRREWCQSRHGQFQPDEIVGSRSSNDL